jgi:hypothetical protein
MDGATATDGATAMGGAAADRRVVDFLKRRFASALRCGDDRTATRLRAQLDRLMNGSAAAAPPPDPELPPAA